MTKIIDNNLDGNILEQTLGNGTNTPNQIHNTKNRHFDSDARQLNYCNSSTTKNQILINARKIKNAKVLIR